MHHFPTKPLYLPAPLVDGVVIIGIIKQRPQG